jgi:hypothetical protein
MAFVGFCRQAFDWMRHEVLEEMSATGETETNSIPGTVFSPRQVRILKIAVILMGILLVGGFAFVLAAIVYQASRPAQDKTAVSATALSREGMLDMDLAVPREASITGLDLDGDRLAVTLGGAAPEIVVIDLASGKTVARLRLKPQ